MVVFPKIPCCLKRLVSFPKISLSPYVHVQSVANLKLGHRKEAVGSPKRSSLMSETHELNISDEFSLVLSFAEKERIS
jgi:hypothetical protein